MRMKLVATREISKIGDELYRTDDSLDAEAVQIREKMRGRLVWDGIMISLNNN